MILVGPSGCGKSTLLRMIVGLEDITVGRHGDRRQAGQRPGAARPQPRDGVPELRALPAPDRLREHRVPAAAGQGVRATRSTRRSARRRKTLELDEHLERKPGNLSGGQRQRVAMGRAIVREADAFLFDEPLSNLDAKLRGQMRTEISRLQKRLGITTVYVTHDQTEAMTLGDRVAVLKRGVLQQLATPRELYEQPRQPLRRRLHRLAADELPAGDRRGQPRSKLPFGTVDAAARDAPRRPQGKGLLIAGIRPEHFEDASVVDQDKRGRGSTFNATVDVVEWLGNETYAYIPFEAPEEVQRQLTQLERDLDGESMRTQLVVSLDGEPVREGERPRSSSTLPRCTCSTRPPARTSRSGQAGTRGRPRGHPSTTTSSRGAVG